MCDGWSPGGGGRVGCLSVSPLTALLPVLVLQSQTTGPLLTLVWGTQDHVHSPLTLAEDYKENLSHTTLRTSASSM